MDVVESDAYHLNNGQELLFCSMGHVSTFRASPVWPSLHPSKFIFVLIIYCSSTQEKYIADFNMTAAGHVDSYLHSADEMCPVCGMSTDGSHGVNVVGDQPIYTCSAAHAQSVSENMVRRFIKSINFLHLLTMPMRSPIN
jgi:hypothetical protein